MIKIIQTILSWLLISAFIPALVTAQSVIKYPESGQKLSKKWEWAAKKSGDRKIKEGCWIAYSIEKMMGENSYIGSFRHGSWKKEITLGEIIYNKKPGQDKPKKSDDEVVREAAIRALKEIQNENEPEKMVKKEIVFLFEFESGKSKSPQFSEFKTSNMYLNVDLENKPIIWLGKASQSESIDFLSRFYSKLKDDELKEDMITGISVHTTSPRVIKFLTGVIKSQEHEEIREKAVFWIGEHESDDVLKLLVKIAQKDRSREVREEAVFSISRIDSDDALDHLIDLANHAKSKDVRKKAVFWLGQKASDKAAKVLNEMAYDKEDYEIQKNAVFALSQLDGEEGVTHLIKIAKSHPNPKIRKKAIFWLGESSDPRALETLIEIARNR